MAPDAELRPEQGGRKRWCGGARLGDVAARALASTVPSALSPQHWQQPPGLLDLPASPDSLCWSQPDVAADPS